MAYSDLDKSHAFILYSSGLSYRRIAESMHNRPGCEKITHTTIRDWAETPDASGQVWDDRKRETDALIKAGENSAIVRRNKDILQETGEIIDTVLDEIKDKKLEFKTKAEAIYAFRTLHDLREKIGEKRKRVSIADQVRCLIDALNEIPEVHDVIERNWDNIYKRFEMKARELMARKNHG